MGSSWILCSLIFGGVWFVGWVILTEYAKDVYGRYETWRVFWKCLKGDAKKSMATIARVMAVGLILQVCLLVVMSK